MKNDTYKQKKTTITYPDVSQLNSYQIEVLRHPARFQILNWARRHYKTSTALTKLIVECLANRYKTFWYVAPTFGMAKESVWKDPGMLFSERIMPPGCVEKINESELTIYFNNKSLLVLKSAEDISRLRGGSPWGVVLDEYALMNPTIFPEIIEPILRQNDGWCWMTSTPRGKNHFYEMFLRGLDEDEDNEYKSWTLKASQSGIISGAQLAIAKRDMPSDLYNQEWECDFLEGIGSIFRDIPSILTAEPKPPESGHLYVIGLDLAKANDFTALSVFDRATNSMVYFARWNKLDWPFTKLKIAEIAKHYNNALVYIDSTGLGSPIVDDLQREGIACEPYIFTENSKKNLIEKLAVYIETKRIKLINEESIKRELEAFSYTIGANGHIHYNAPTGYHDDNVISIALGVYGLNPTPTKLEPKDEATPLKRCKERLLGVLRNNGIDARLQERLEREWAET